MESMKNSVKTSESISVESQHVKPCCNADDPADICCKDKDQNISNGERSSSAGCCTPQKKGKVGCC